MCVSREEEYGLVELESEELFAAAFLCCQPSACGIDDRGRVRDRFWTPDVVQFGPAAQINLQFVLLVSEHAVVSRGHESLFFLLLLARATSLLGFFLVVSIESYHSCHNEKACHSEGEVEDVLHYWEKEELEQGGHR